jgi:hypothetical protein
VLLNRLRTTLAAALLEAAAVTALFAQQAPYGIHPRSSPTEYAVSLQTPSGTYAASLVPSDEVKRLFAVDISKTYIVLEVACYPPAGPVQISPEDFLIKSGTNSSEFTHPADAVTVASVEVGYESGIDPVTGRRVHGTYTGVGTGVEVGPDNAPPPPPRPGSTSYDRMTLEQQLAQRALPDGTFNAPVAGFLYFPAKEVKKKNGVYELEYLASGSSPVRLQVPTKVH